MKAQAIDNRIDYKKVGNNPQFGNAATWVPGALRFLQNDPAWGAVAVDVAAMTGPRTIVDFVERGPNIGIETGRQQGSSTLNHALFGVYGAGAGALLAFSLNKKLGISAHKILASSDVINNFGETYAKHVSANSPNAVNGYLNEILSGVKTINNNGDQVGISDGTVRKVINFYNDNVATLDLAKDKKAVKDARKAIHAMILKDTGSESNFKLGSVVHETGGKLAVASDKAKTSVVVSLDSFVDNLISITNTFKKEGITQQFADQADKGAKFLKRLTTLGTSRSVLGLGFAGLLGLSIQPINTYLTRKKTGCDGFVGVAGREKDKSSGFKALKAGTALAGLTAAICSIGNPGQLLKNIQFTGIAPTLAQFKLIYAVTITSRLLSARDKDELREALVRDSIGFVNWLILGSVVSKLITKGLDPTLIKGEWNKDSVVKSFFKCTPVTRDEVVSNAIKAMGTDTVKDGKAKLFKDMLMELKNAAKAGGENADIAKAALKKLGVISKAQVGGFLYSCIVLGILLPKFNIHMTRKSEAKRQALAAEKAKAAKTA